MRILVDLDGVCNYCHEELVRVYNRDKGTNWTTLDVDHWDFEKTKLPDAHYIFTLEGFFYNLVPRQDAISALEELISEGHKILIVSSLPRSAKTASWDKYRWVSKYLPMIPYEDIIFTRGKYHVNGDILVDDSFQNCLEFPGQALLFSAPHNTRHSDKDLGDIIRVWDWDEALRKIRRIGNSS